MKELKPSFVGHHFSEEKSLQRAQILKIYIKELDKGKIFIYMI
jgi:hypothetical protein